MTQSLSGDELVGLVRQVFRPRDEAEGLAFLVDLPDAALADNEDWKVRRQLALSWARLLEERRGELGISVVTVAAYRNVRTNNAELPVEVFLYTPDQELPVHADGLPEALRATTETLYEKHTILIAMTELSATAPLKLVGRRLGVRAATMPGFGEPMVPALRLDYDRIDGRVRRLKELLDAAEGARLTFDAGTGDEHRLFLDLRHRSAHASSGLQTETGAVGNLPSGEAYIVPYEGEAEPSRSEGTLPVQLGDDVVIFRVEANRAVEVLTSGGRSDVERAHLERDPAYGNMAELGLGVLADFGVEPCGEILLDEKLGLHVAFGRSDHFGGQVGPSDFSSPDAVVHIDRVYIPQTQPKVSVLELVLEQADGSELTLMSGGKYVVDLD